MSGGGSADGGRRAPTVSGTRDPRSGMLMVPARQFSVDGTLTRCEPTELEGAGRLVEVVRMGERDYGWVDLPGGVRLISVLGPGPHEVGGRYVEVPDAGTRRFDRA